MTPEKLLHWFEQLVAHDPGPTTEEQGHRGYHGPVVDAWHMDATSAIHHAFPQGHPVRLHWERDVVKSMYPRHESLVKSARELLKAALAQLKEGRVSTIADGVTADNVGDLLAQAESLMPAHYLAATVITGGALETFLRHLLTKNGLTWNGHGQISKYHAALAQHRNATGSSVVTRAEEAQILAWGTLRNSAAHNPIDFTANHLAPEVALMIAGVRNLVVKYS